MFQPNSDAIGFCYWMLNISKQKLSGPQRIIVSQVYNAALGNYPIAAQTWYNFNLFTAWRNPYYLVYKDYASFTSITLLTDLIASFSFEGNSDDDTGNFNGTPTDISYGLPYGKVLQGALFNGSTSIVSFNPIPFTNSQTINFWFNPDVSGPATQQILATLTGYYGINFDKSGGYIYVFSAGGVLTTSTLPFGAWSMVSIRINATSCDIFVNGTIYDTVSFTAFSQSFRAIGYPALGTSPKGNLDMLCIWSRTLSNQEISDLWNGGAGLQYPF